MPHNYRPPSRQVQHIQPPLILAFFWHTAAIFWNSNVFEPVEISEGKPLEFQVFDEKQASVKIKLKHKTKGTVYTVVTTHLSSGDDPSNQWERNQQIAELYKVGAPCA